MKFPECGNWIWLDGTEKQRLLPWFQNGTIHGGREIKRNARRSVYFVTDGQGDHYYAKLEKHACLLFRNKAKIEYQAGRILQDAGIPCVHFTAYGRNGLTRTVLVSRAEAGTMDAKEYFFSVAAADPVRRRAFLDSLCALQRKMYGAGIRHGDFHAGNILVREDGSGTCELILVDPVAVRRTGRADRFEIARILNDFCPLLSREEALQLAWDTPELLEQIQRARLEKCAGEWEKRKVQILSGNSKFSRTVRTDDGRQFEIASTLWYAAGAMPEDLASLAVDSVDRKEGDRLWLEMFRARLEGRVPERDFLMREICEDQIHLYRKF